MSEQQLFEAARNMRHMGSFAAAIADAYFAADATNRETLVQAFKGLFQAANPQVKALTPEQQRTRDFMLDVISADGPCTLSHVWLDCKKQGYTKGFEIALHSLKLEKLVETEFDDENVTIISLI